MIRIIPFQTSWIGHIGENWIIFEDGTIEGCWTREEIGQLLGGN